MKLILAAALIAVGAFARSEDCAPCHRAIFETYRQTGMGRSFYRPSPENMSSAPSTYRHEASDSYFTMVSRGGNYFQQRYQLDSAGTRINVMEKQIDYIMGSGNHSRAYLHRTAANALIELPLAWYAENGGYWAMNPGYDRPNHDGFRRPITYDCMFCHNAYPQIPAARDVPTYVGELPEGIDCQRCHGSGAKHISLAATGKREDIRNAIVNPSRLTRDRQLEVCMACHLETTSFPLPNALQRYDRGPFSYKAGEPLADFILNFDNVGHDDKFEIVNAGYRLRRSACFLKSQMTCSTCHNPHDIPRAEKAATHYDGACRKCHAADFDKQVTAGKHTRESGCANCHMPKRRTEDVVHVAATDHLIQRRKPAGNLLAERQETQNVYRGPVVLYYPETLPITAENELYLAVAQVKQGSGLVAGIAQLTAAIQRHAPQRAEWYLELAEAVDSNGQLAGALPWYREAARRKPALGSQKLGAALRKLGQPADAVAVLKQAPVSAVTWHEMGLAYQALGKTADALAALGKALALDPDMPEAHNNLGSVWLANGNAARAEPAFREAIRIRPDYADAHANLASLLSTAGQLSEARQEFELTLRQRSKDAPTRYNYAMMLGRTGQYDDAQSQLEISLRDDPQFADSHLLLADLLMARQQAAAAIGHYREALRIRPDSSRAHLGLAAALISTGDRESALTHLKAAAGASDAVVRQQATQLLRELEGRQ